MRRASKLRRLIAGVALAALPLVAGAGDNCSGTVYLTFDTGNMSQAETIARILDREQVKATFFLANEKTFRGDHALDPSWRDYWRARAAEGHTFGNHTYLHAYLRQDLPGGRIRAFLPDGKEQILDEEAFCAELRETDERVHAYTGGHLAGLWRAPGGRVTQQATRWAAACGYPVHVLWDDAGFIGDELPSDKYPNDMLLKRALADIGPGTIALMHLGIWSRRDPLAPILEPLIQGLKAKGLCFAPLAAAQR
jgi:peptidoglycan/xylan/chitin deacetylase (PgdA/CDA1 family)